MVTRNPILHERVHVRRQLPNTGGTSGTGKLTKREDERVRL